MMALLVTQGLYYWRFRESARIISDFVYSPRANDNASGVAVILVPAEIFIQQGLTKQLAFLFYQC